MKAGAKTFTTQEHGVSFGNSPAWENFWALLEDFHVGRSVGRGRDAISDNGLLAGSGLMPSLPHGRITLFRRQQDSPCWSSWPFL